MQNKDRVEAMLANVLNRRGDYLAYAWEEMLTHDQKVKFMRMIAGCASNMVAGSMDIRERALALMDLVLSGRVEIVYDDTTDSVLPQLNAKAKAPTRKTALSCEERKLLNIVVEEFEGGQD